MVIVAWKKVCVDYEERGFAISGTMGYSFKEQGFKEFILYQSSHLFFNMEWGKS